MTLSPWRTLKDITMPASLLSDFLPLLLGSPRALLQLRNIIFFLAFGRLGLLVYLVRYYLMIWRVLLVFKLL